MKDRLLEFMKLARTVRDDGRTDTDTGLLFFCARPQCYDYSWLTTGEFDHFVEVNAERYESRRWRTDRTKVSEAKRQAIRFLQLRGKYPFR